MHHDNILLALAVLYQAEETCILFLSQTVEKTMNMETRDVRCPPLSLSTIYVFVLCFETMSFTRIGAHWLASDHQGSTCLCLTPFPRNTVGFQVHAPAPIFFLNAGYLNLGPHEASPLPAEPPLQPRHEGFRAQPHVLASLRFLAADAVVVLYLLTFWKNRYT